MRLPARRPIGLSSISWLPIAVAMALAAAAAPPQEPGQPPRLHTSRPAGAHLLQLPKEDDAFGFVVFGDRTGGPPEGIEVLRQAVHDTNLLDPDLVLTVGDLVNGYNGSEQWQRQADEYRTAMGALRMPWFPVAGNHDIYWRGQDKPAGEHEREYEATFGPLWYAVQHKRCWFVVLYSDEGDPASGRKDFDDPACQRFSDEQFEWLRQTLERAKPARHVFVFLHHPRWIADRYPGADWDRVHSLLARNGNVTAVFAGHIHRMRFDGVRDGIQYYTVASVGAFLDMDAPQVGYLHEFHVVTVRPEGITVAALPVGTVIDPQAITGEISEDCSRLAKERLVEPDRAARFSADGGFDGLLRFTVHNPARHPIELTVLPEAEDGWTFSPDHTHVVVPPGERSAVALAAQRAISDAAPRMPRLVLRADYLATGLRASLPERSQRLFVRPPALAAAAAPASGALQLDGSTACVGVADELLDVPSGPLTLEAWVLADSVAGRRGIAAKLENSDYGLLVQDGKLMFLVHAGTGYAVAGTAEPVLATGRWVHVAGTYDGEHARLWLDGALVAETQAHGERKTNPHPLWIGADPDRNGEPMSQFAGWIDEVRLSRVARYDAPFAPASRFEPDRGTALLLHLDEDRGAWTPDASAAEAHAERRGTARCAPAPTR